MNADVYEIITDRIIALLEKGTVPWQKPWQGADLAPANLVSKKHYRGVNVFLLHAMSYSSPYWVSFKQAKALGGSVRKGEKACPVVFWKWLEVEKDGIKSRIPFLRYYSAFNVCQCDNLEKHLPASEIVTREHSPVAAAEAIVAGYKGAPPIKTGQAHAFYSPSGDYVGMPAPEAFRSGEEYYSVLFHELTHSTGHESRLARPGVASQTNGFGSQSYSKEELVAEMGAAFLCGSAGIVERTVDNSASYVASWLKVLKGDVKMVVQAAGAAQKAADFILGTTFAESTTEE